MKPRLRRLSLAALAAALLAAPAAPARALGFELPWAGEMRFSGTEYAYFEMNETAADSDYDKVKNILSLNLAGQGFSVGLELRYLHYSDLERADALDLDRTGKELELRKYYLDVLQEHLALRLGTFYSSLGRGLTLYVQKNDTLGFDEPIRGGTVTATWGALDFTALGGQVTDPVLSVQYDREFEDRLVGYRTLARLPLGFYAGASVAAAGLESEFEPDRRDDVDLWSLEAGALALADHVDVQGEWAEVDRSDSSFGEYGYGRYVSVSSTVGPVTGLAEYKDYWNFQYRYNNPPTAGKVDEEYESNDVRGGRLRLDYGLEATGTLLYASYGRYNTHRHEFSFGGIEGDRQLEWYVGLEQTLGPVYVDSVFWRRDYSDQEVVQEHLSADINWAVTERNSVNAFFEVKTEETRFFTTREHKSYLSYSLSPYLAATVHYAWNETTHQPTEEFWAGEVSVTPISSLTGRIFYGQTPGGLVCSGGQCRQESPFEGLKLEAIWRF